MIGRALSLIARPRGPSRAAIATACILGGFFLSVPQQSRSGPNEGGVLIVNTAPELQVTADLDYCELYELTRCADAVTNLPSSSQSHIWWVVAAFPTDVPRLIGIQFGIDYDIGLLR